MVLIQFRNNIVTYGSITRCYSDNRWIVYLSSISRSDQFPPVIRDVFFNNIETIVLHSCYSYFAFKNNIRIVNDYN